MVENIQWLGHDTFKIVGEKVIYTDPYQIKERGKADLILITHCHFDHCSPEDIAKVAGPQTTIVLPLDCDPKYKGTVQTISPGESINVKGIPIEAVPAYNTNKNFHPKSNNWVGYVFTVNGQRIYIAGDTDYIAEMKNLGNIDVAIVPVSGTYVMTASEAARAVLDIKPKVAIPMHYGTIVGSIADAKTFADKLKGKVEVVILKAP
ncbi:MAG: MBL fold metallo-hydrolase [Nitrospirae bacterium]|nr:MBL fold metallo-hydrolase [Nitrospirota bacterium]